MQNENGSKTVRQSNLDSKGNFSGEAKSCHRVKFSESCCSVSQRFDDPTPSKVKTI